MAGVGGAGPGVWLGPAWERGATPRLFQPGGAEFRFAAADAGPFVAVAFPERWLGLGLQLAGRQFGPGLVARFARGERAWIRGEGPADDAGRGAVGWGVLPAAANARALEVWAKKQAYLRWVGGGVDANLGGFDVTHPGVLGVRFLPVDWRGEAPGLTGWACTDDPAVTGFDVSWVDAADLVLGGEAEPRPAGEMSAQFWVEGDLIDVDEITRVAGVEPTGTVARDRFHWRGRSWESWSLEVVADPVAFGDAVGWGGRSIMDVLGPLADLLGPNAAALGAYCRAHYLDAGLFAKVDSADAALPELLVPPAVGCLASLLGVRFAMEVRTYWL
jgi:hypothetical protein